MPAPSSTKFEESVALTPAGSPIATPPNMDVDLTGATPSPALDLSSGKSSTTSSDPEPVPPEDIPADTLKLPAGSSLSPNKPHVGAAGPRTGTALQRILGHAPKMPRMLTAMSFPSETSGSSHGKTAEASGKPRLTKMMSKMSFSSWRSGASRGSSKSSASKSHSGTSPSETAVSEGSDKSSSVKKKISKVKDSYLPEGERCISFETPGVAVLPPTLNEAKLGCPNKIRTAKFTPLTWLPKSLLAQFQRVANIYFLCIVVLVMFPWSPKDWKSKVFPFCLVLLWTALKDLHEDSRRRRDDNLENNQKTLCFDPSSKQFLYVPWQQIKVGDLVIVECDKPFPADLILLHTDSEGLESYISTISLDGETNLKERRPPASVSKNFKPVYDTAVANAVANGEIPPLGGGTQSIMIEKVAQVSLHLVHHMQAINFSVRLGKPEVSVQDVKGVITSTVQHDTPIAVSNFLARGCVLRNTTWAFALVTFAGDETKTRLNHAKAVTKTSNMQKYLNICVWGLLLSLFALCIYAATMSVLQEESASFCCEDESWLIRLGTFTVTFYHVVPMSLYVCFEMLKLILGYQVNNDQQMRDPETGELAVARTADLIEEMGQINFVFSDKTGTLTKNQMIFARACVSGSDLGDFRKSADEETAEGVVKCRAGLLDMKREDQHQRFWKDVHWFFTCLATCHSVEVSKKTKLLSAETATKEELAAIQYVGASPDEVALVEIAQDVGVVFCNRTHGKSRSSSTFSEMAMQFPDGSAKVCVVLYELQFNSDRKRMSVIVRLGSELIIITKGADSVMEGLLATPLAQEDKDYINQYSSQGLRTLVVAYKKLDKTKFREWEKEYKIAQSATDSSKFEQVAAMQSAIETDLKYAGITAVEDCLQDGVPEAIATIKDAGVRIWVLTGDKTETAVDIARSCQLFTQSTTLAYATGADSEEAAYAKLMDASRKFDGVENCGLVLDGETIQYCLPSDRCKQLILDLGLASSSCVCCRLNPLQKRNIVDIVKMRDPTMITLAIGDGANDVPMIEGAHLGIGIRGNEGAQAVQVSDVAISQFRFLVPLLLCHGRRAYRRVSLYLCYYLYKNVALLMGDVVWMHMDSFRGRIAFPEYVSINYNVFFTSWHILFVLGWDNDVPDEVATKNPHLYHVGPKRALFNKMVFTRWMITAVYHGVAAWLVPALWIIDGAEYNKKIPGQFWEGSITAFTCIVFVVCLKLLLSSQSPFKLTTSILPTLGAVLCYFMGLLIIANIPPMPTLQPCMQGIPEALMNNGNALIAMVSVPLAITFVDLVIGSVYTRLYPNELQSLRSSLNGSRWARGVASADEHVAPGCMERVSSLASGINLDTESFGSGDQKV